MTILEVNHLSKRYGHKKAVDKLSFSVQKGDLFAFLGVNGAGKSTTINMIATRLAPSEGSISVNGALVGIDDHLIRNMIGIVFQDNVLDGLLTVKENLSMWCKLYGLNKKTAAERVQWVTEMLQLGPLLNIRFHRLSGGQKRKAEIARALLHHPNILFLDEPTTGLDPQTRIDVWHTISSLQQKMNMTVFLTTHYMEEAATADRIVIIDRGSIKAQGTPLELKQRFASDLLKIHSCNEAETLHYLNEKGILFEKKQGGFLIKLNKSTQALHILKHLEDYIADFEVIKGSLDDVFLKLTEGSS